MNKEKIFLYPLYQKLGIKSSKVKEKASEFLYTLDYKSPGGIGPGDGCKYVACLHLACKMFGVPFDREKALSNTGVSSKVYKDTYNIISNILNVSPTMTLEEICTKFGCNHALPVSKKILEKYKESFLSGLSDDKKKQADFNKPVFNVVAFYLSTEYLNIKMNKDSLLDFTDITSSDFEAKYISMKELTIGHIQEKLENGNNTLKQEKKNQKKKVTKKEKKDENNDKKEDPLNKSQSEQNQKSSQVIYLNDVLTLEFNEEENEKFEESLADAAGSYKPLSKMERRKRKLEEFEAWKQKSIEIDSKSKGKKKIQTTLKFRKLSDKDESEDS